MDLAVVTVSLPLLLYVTALSTDTTSRSQEMLEDITEVGAETAAQSPGLLGREERGSHTGWSRAIASAAYLWQQQGAPAMASALRGLWLLYRCRPGWEPRRRGT